MQESIQEIFGRILNKTLNGKSDSDQHLMTLFSLVLQTKAKNVLELGVRFGDTSDALIAGVALTGGKLTCLDIHPTQWKCPEDLQSIYTFVQQDAIKFLEGEVKKGSYYDLVFVDDFHTYPHVKKELELIEKITNKNSIILLHDLMGSGCAPKYYNPINAKNTEWDYGGPFRAVSELDTNIWEWMTIPVCNGLTLLKKKPEILNF